MGKYAIRKQTGLHAVFFISPWLIGYIFFYMLPFITTLFWSFTDFKFVGNLNFIGFKNYVKIFIDKGLYGIVGNTLFFMIFGTLGSVIISLFISLLLVRKIIGVKIFRTIFMLPILIPTVAATIIWVLLLNTDYGVFNDILGYFGIGPIGWLTDRNWVKPSILMILIWGQSKLVLIFVAAIKNVSQVGIKDLTLLNGEQKDRVSSGVIFDNTGDSFISHITSQGFSCYGALLRNNTFLCRIEGGSFCDNQFAAIGLEELFRKGRIGDFVPNTISGCTIYGGNIGIFTKRSIVANITDCQIFQTQGDGIVLTDRSNSILISSCRTFQLGGVAVSVHNTHEINISANIFCWHRKECIKLDTVSWGTICGNNLIDSGVRDPDGAERTALVLRNAKGLQISGNAIFNWGDQVPMKHAIEEDGSSINNNFSNNNINYCAAEPAISTEKARIEGNIVCSKEAYEPTQPSYGDNPTTCPDFDCEGMLEFLRFWSKRLNRVIH